MSYQELKKSVFEANKKIVEYNLVTLTWGNVSEIDRSRSVVAIKPSGVDYKIMTEDDIVIVDLEGNVVEGDLNPSSDLPTHLYIYTLHESIKSVVHTHSLHATSFAQAGLDIKVRGTTHADHFFGTIPCTRRMTKEEIQSNYEYNTGVVIGETFKSRNISAKDVMACLVNNHGPFAWGESSIQAVENALVLEVVAQMNMNTSLLAPNVDVISDELLRKHYLRKHGSEAYYGQAKK